MCLHSLPAKAQFVSYCGRTQMIEVGGASPLEELGTLLDRTSQKVLTPTMDSLLSAEHTSW